MKKLRAGVIGAGAMGKHHARIYSEMQGAELVGVADVDERTSSEVAAEYNTETFTDYERLLKNDLDAVSIAVPTTLHKKIALKAANYGVHMLVEKPIAESLKSADAIIDAATITATGGVAHADHLEQSLEIWEGEDVREVEIEKQEPLKNELEHFMHAIVNDEEPSSTGEEGKYALYVAISAIEPYEKGENIRLNLN